MDIDKLTLSFSSLKQFGKSPAHFVGYKNRIFKQSAPMRRGWLTHLITLEPEKIQELRVLDVATRANKQYKEAVANHKDGENGVFTAREMLEAQNLALAVKEHPLASKLPIREQLSAHLWWPIFLDRQITLAGPLDPKGFLPFVDVISGSRWPGVNGGPAE